MLCGLTPKRWSNLERGYRNPGPEEHKTISRFLNFRHTFASSNGVTRQLLHSGARLTPSQKPFAHDLDRMTHIRYCTLCKCHPALAATLRERILSRPDHERCHHMCHQIRCDSHLESLYLAALLAQGAEPCLIAPASLARPPHTVMDDAGRMMVGLQPRPCFFLNGCHQFFQVSFKIPNLVRIDVLRWDGAWSVLEIDGKGHDTSGDWVKERQLQIPVRRMTGVELVRWSEAVIGAVAA
jgi:hypothetical protein